MGPGHNTYHWTAEQVQFMADAAEYGSFPGIFAAAIAAEVPVHGHICDAGCGTGWLAAALARRFAAVTAVDTSAEALAVLRKDGGTPENLQIVQDDIFTYQPKRKFDAMVFCLFGRMHEILRIAKRCGAGTVVAVKKAFTHHRFSVSRVPLKDETTEQAAAFLREHGVPFTLETREFDMGQPVRSLEDAARFFAVYSKDAPGTLTQQAVLQKLIETGDKAFPYYVPQRKSLGRFTIHTADIPEEFV